ncbi:MAG: glycosyltransferase family 2 protein [Chitinophagales bacterium]|nr:glycosyltransferase family 2 protein [Chitinophagales bacterium]
MSEVTGEISNQVRSGFPLVSVGVPTFNRPEGLKKCLEYLIDQTYTNLEIIISDNCSSDPAVQDLINSFAEKDKRVKYFRQTENIGLEGNFNFVFSQSRAEYFMWMSDDDYFDKDYVEKCVQFLETNSGYVLCSGVAKYYSNDKFLFEENMFMVDGESPRKRIFKYFSRVGKNGNFYGVFKKKVADMEPIGRYIGCDWVFMGRLSILGKLAFVDTTNYYRSAEGHSTSRRSMIKKFKFNLIQALFFETYSAYIISKNLFKSPLVHKKFDWPNRNLIALCLFFKLNWKYFRHAIVRRLR